LVEVAVPRSLFQRILDLVDDLRQRPVPAWAEKFRNEVKTMGEVHLDGEKLSRLGVWTPPTDKYRIIRKVRRDAG
jgi:hypothetical protein